MTTFRPLALIILLGLPLTAYSAESTLGGGRYGEFTHKVADGPHMSVICATDFGGPGYEEFIAAGEFADGSVAGVGNAWGPALPATVPVIVLGRGAHSGNPQTIADKNGKVSPDPNSVDRAGIVVVYNRDKSGLHAKRLIRFDWGVATITAARTTSDGARLIVAGHCQASFPSLAPTTKLSKLVSASTSDESADKSSKKKSKKEGASAGDEFVAMLSPEGQVDWIVGLEKTGTGPADIFLDGEGRVYVDAHGLTRIAALGAGAKSGLEVVVINSATKTGQAAWLNVDQAGNAYYGGDRNTKTGHQPWRQPYLHQFDAKGEKQLTLYEFKPTECACGGDGNGLCSDSSVRGMAFGPHGDWWLSGWSDGGNSVFGRQAADWHENAKEAGFGMNAAGVGVASLAHLMHFEPGGKQTLSHTLWVTYTPQFIGDPDDPKTKRARGKPNSARIKHLTTLENGSVAFTGGASTGLIQTPNAFWRDPMLPKGYGGEMAVVFRPEMDGLLFSSYLPGVSEPNLAPCKNGVLIAARTVEDDGWVQPTKSPSVNADQKFGGGVDAFLMLMEFPPR